METVGNKINVIEDAHVPASPSTPVAGAGFRRDIAGLRALAVGVVVLYHSEVPGFSGGFIGVDVFFVISGFLITGILVKELLRTDRISVPEFYARRIRRILPVATLIGVAILLVFRLDFPPLVHPGLRLDGIASALFSMNIRAVTTHVDYQNRSAFVTPFLHFWSLAVEEQFYLVWPLVLFAVTRGRRATVQRRLAIAVTITIAVSFALSVRLTETSPVWAFYMLPTRAWELAAGGALALGARRLADLPRLAATVLSWFGLLMILLATVVLNDSHPFPGWQAVFPVIATAALIAGGCARPERGAERILGLSLFQWVGALSFSIYLWHWPLLVYVDDRPKTPVSLATVWAATLALSVLTYYAVERPVRGSRMLRAHRGWTLAMGAGLISFMLLVALIALPDPTLTSGTAVEAAPRASELEATLPSDVMPVAKVVPSNIVPTLTDATTYDPGEGLGDCFVHTSEGSSPPCTFGDPASKTSVVLFGDSHAAHLFPAFKAAAERHHWRLTVLTRAACPFPSVTVAKSSGGTNDACDRWREESLRRIRQERPSLVALSSAVRSIVGVGHPGTEQWRAAWAAGITTTLSSLPSGTEAVVLGNSPSARQDLLGCLSAHLRDVQACTQSKRDSIQPEQIQAEREATTKAGAHFVDTTPLVCTQDPCPVIAWNVLIYVDSDHISRDYARLLEPALAADLQPFLPSD